MRSFLSKKMMATPSTSQSPLNRATQERWVRTYSGHKEADALALAGGPVAGASRAVFDAQAAWQKWHQGVCDSWFNDAQSPLYQALEQARVELLAADELPGVAKNLRGVTLQGLDLPAPAKQLYSSARIFWGLPFEGHGASGAGGSASMQSLTRGLISKLRRQLRRDPLRLLDSPALNDHLRAAAESLDDEQAFARSVAPLIERLSGKGPDNTNQLNPGDSDETTSEPTCDGTEVGYGDEQKPESFSRIGKYPIFRTAWDECAPAKAWFRTEDEKALHELDALDRKRVRRLAHDLQRRLRVKRMRHWDFELEEGMLDSRKLAALVGEYPDHRVFKAERQARIPEACVTLLVDQSGSMRGSAHLLAAQALDVAVHTLEVCGVAVEVLGYTTRYGSENPVVESWRRAGSPEFPGRLNALRHIVIKAAGQPWRVCRRYLGLLLRPDFGRENIDGESIHWAAQRLLARPERRKILLVLSDGTPYDEATVQNNDLQILSNHLRAVLQATEKTSIQLLGVGTGRDVGRYYRNAATVRRGGQVAEVLFGMLGDAFDQIAFR